MSTEDQIFTVLQIMKKCGTVIDFKQSYGGINREAIFIAMKELVTVTKLKLNAFTKRALNSSLCDYKNVSSSALNNIETITAVTVFFYHLFYFLC